MKLIEIHIHNFRSIIDQTISTHGYTLLVGANNSGKSTIIDAIRAFYEKDGFKFKKECDFPFKGANGEESWIDLTFSLTELENDSLKKEYQTLEKKLKVKKYFLSSEKSKTGTIFAYESNGKLSTDSFYGAKNVQSGKFGDLIYIPAVSKIDEHTKLSGPSALRDLLTNIMSGVVAKSDAYKVLKGRINDFSDQIKLLKTDNNFSLSSFEEELNSSLEPWQTNFKLTFAPPSTTDIIKSMLGWDIREDIHDKAQGIEYFGSGFQRHFIYSLIRLGAKYALQKPSDKAKDFTPTLNLVLFEEPEAFLHPPQQNELSRNLVKVIKADDWQVLCSTHSSHFVSLNTEHIPAIVRLQRDEGIVSAFQITEKKWQSIIEENQKINDIVSNPHGDDRREEMESIKYFLWLNPDRAGLFFSNGVLIVEGQSEKSFINRLIDDGEINIPSGIYVLDGMGKYNIHRFMNLLSDFGISHSVLYDDDNEKGIHKELNQLIVDSGQKDFLIKIQSVPNELESLLNIECAGDKHRKPQHILYCYSTGKIKEENLNKFCDLVQCCFPSTEKHAQ